MCYNRVYPSCVLSSLFIMTVVVSLSAFLTFISELFVSSVIAFLSFSGRLGIADGMFIVFWDTGSDFFQSDPNNNSDPISFNRTR